MPKRLGKDDRPKDVNQLSQYLVRMTTQDDEEPPAKTRAKVQSISRDAQSQYPAKSESGPSPVTRSEISRVMAAMGKKGGIVSAKSRMVKITPQERSRIALNAARARWAKPKKRG
jgi:hypothetical protein